MPRAMLMDPNEAIDAIGEGLVNYVPKRDFDARLYPYPGWGQHTYGVEKPTILSRWDGPAEDRPTERTDIEIPSALRYDVRIIHPSRDGPAGVMDTFANAQIQVKKGFSKFFVAMSKNRHMNDLILDVGIEASIVGDLIDPTTQEPFYGLEMVMIVKVW